MHGWRVRRARASNVRMSTERYTSFREFYPFYLGEHTDRRNRRLHFLGSSLGLLCLGMLIGTGEWRWLGFGLLAGYACAWVGHFFFEHNRPATFRYPLYSFLGDWVMYGQMWRGKLPF